MDNIQIFHQSVFDTWPIEDNSIQSIITSPPYWGLRKYDIPDVVIGGNNNCHAWKGQYGLEPSYKDYIEHTLLWCKEVYRVLRDDGIFFLNIGDSYQTQSDINAGKNPEKYANLSMNAITMHVKQQDLPNKCRMLIPERIAIALIDNGWTLRNHIIWHKPNGMPESTKDRFSKKWESIFMFVKNEKYYFDLDEIREGISPNSITRVESFKRNNETFNVDKHKKGEGGQSGMEVLRNAQNGKWLTKGKNPGDVWQINPQPSSEKHFAMWPEKLVERMLLCSTKENDIILDPFCGSATTLKVAVKNNRQAIGIDLGYSDIQERKLNNIQKNII